MQRPACASHGEIYCKTSKKTSSKQLYRLKCGTVLQDVIYAGRGLSCLLQFASIVDSSKWVMSCPCLAPGVPYRQREGERERERKRERENEDKVHLSSAWLNWRFLPPSFILCFFSLFLFLSLFISLSLSFSLFSYLRYSHVLSLSYSSSLLLSLSFLSLYLHPPPPLPPLVSPLFPPSFPLPPPSFLLSKMGALKMSAERARTINQPIRALVCGC